MSSVPQKLSDEVRQLKADELQLTELEKTIYNRIVNIKTLKKELLIKKVQGDGEEIPYEFLKFHHKCTKEDMVDGVFRAVVYEETPLKNKSYPKIYIPGSACLTCGCVYALWEAPADLSCVLSLESYPEATAEFFWTWKYNYFKIK